MVESEQSDALYRRIESDIDSLYMKADKGSLEERCLLKALDSIALAHDAYADKVEASSGQENFPSRT